MKQMTEATLTYTLNSLPHAFFNEAIDLARTGELDGARNKLLVALTLEPEMVDAHVVLAKIYAQMGDYDRAIGTWEVALHLAPENEAAQSGIARARELQKETVKARTRGKLTRIALSVALFVLGGIALHGYRSISVMLTPAAIDSIRAVLRDNPALGDAELTVIAKDESIEVSGTVPTQEKKDLVSALAAREARGFPLDVSNIRISHSQPLAESFHNLARELGDEELQGVVATERQQVLFLSGEVPYGAYIQRAEALARAMGGVRSVDARELVVSERARSPIAEKVRASLLNTPDLAGAQLEVDAEEHVMKIVGQVLTHQQARLAKTIAESAARHISVDVSMLTVQHPTPAAESIERLLNELEPSDVSSIRITEQDGTLYLAGTVTTDSKKKRLQSMAHALVGVQRVDTSELQSLGAKAYTLQSGDTLWDLAVRFYDDGRQLDKIIKGNPQLPSDFRRIRTGTQIMIYPR